MTYHPKISIIVPVRNRPQWITKTIPTILNQQNIQSDIIIVDDGSKDNTFEICRQKWSSYPNVRIIKTAPLGVSYARNLGVSLSRYEWISFCDSDDQWHPKKSFLQWHYLQNNQFLIGQTEEIWIRNHIRVNPKKKHQKKEGLIFESSTKMCSISPSSVMIHRSVWDQFGGFDTDYIACEDYELWLRITAQYPVGLTPEKLITKYGGHKDQLSRTIPMLDLYRLRALITCRKDQPLSDEQIRFVNQAIASKWSIIYNGLIKRGKLDVLQNLYSEFPEVLKIT